LQKEGVQVPASMATGSKMLKAAESELGGARYAESVDRMNEQFTRAALSRIGVDETHATPPVLNKAATDIGAQFDAIAARNPSIPLGTFPQIAANVANDFKNLTGAESPLINQFIQRIGSGPISGKTYQAIQSDIQRYARASSNPELRNALYDLKSGLDFEIQNGLVNQVDAQAWANARRQWANLMTVQKAVSGTTQTAAEGIITPPALARAIDSMGRGNYARGRGDFADLARAGNVIMKPLQDSGTASRLAAKAIPAAIAAAATGGFGALPMIAGSVAGPWAAGRALMSPWVQRYLANQLALRGPLANLRTTRSLGAIAGPSFYQGQQSNED
jgi:hypothetical protein